MLTNQNKALQAQLSEMKRKQAESDCKVRMERGGEGVTVAKKRAEQCWLDRGGCSARLVFPPGQTVR